MVWFPPTGKQLAVTAGWFLTGLTLFGVGAHLSYVNIAPQQARTKAAAILSGNTSGRSTATKVAASNGCHSDRGGHLSIRSCDSSRSLSLSPHPFFLPKYIKYLSTCPPPPCW
ncbi:unnamed protein product [Spirodela intermedia]|uniref:Uncharacterized protein n=2 Tax=Spirodela intermedia TaxID=51605 RepID=A0A7I8IXH1_SPIIN|nr:unnamed protein product [Spirodela intermedia]CAA6662706.1 unnamed protein product [Spirodela intermedia]